MKEMKKNEDDGEIQVRGGFMKVKISDLEKYKSQVIVGYETSMKGVNNTINCLLDPDYWKDDSNDLFFYIFKVVGGFRAIIKYLLINNDMDILKKAEPIIKIQRSRFQELQKVQLSGLSYGELNGLIEYYDSVLVIQLLTDKYFDLSLLDKGLQAFGRLEKVMKKKDEYLRERTSTELIRRLLKKDYEYVIYKFKKSMKLSLKKNEDGEWKHAAKACYLLAKIALGDKSESLLNDAVSYLTILKFEWQGRHINRDFGLLLDVESFVLLEYAYENIVGKYSGDVFDIFKRFKPNTVVEELIVIAQL